MYLHKIFYQIKHIVNYHIMSNAMRFSTIWWRSVMIMLNNCVQKCVGVQSYFKLIVTRSWRNSRLYTMHSIATQCIGFVWFFYRVEMYMKSRSFRWRLYLTLSNRFTSLVSKTKIEKMLYHDFRQWQPCMRVENHCLQSKR